MLILRTPEDIERVQPEELRRLVRDREEAIAATREEGDPESYFIVLDPGDSQRDLQRQLGFSVFESRFDASIFGAPDFTPPFELMEEHDCCVELVFVLSDDGAGAIVFIPNGVNFDPQLAALRERYAIRAQEG